MENKKLVVTPGQINEIKAIIANALREDMGGFGSQGDISALSTIPSNFQGTAKFLAKADGVLAGLFVADLVFDMVDSKLKTKWTKNDGDSVRAGEYFGEVSGSASSIIQAERLALNLMQRMSGVATQTRRMVDAVKHTNTRILDTRKTVPGLRVLDKLAVVIGGGCNHRYGLFDMVMIKDNHISASGGVAQALQNVHAFLLKHASLQNVKIELETRTLDEVKEAMAIGGFDRIMLDNMVKVQDGKIDTSMLKAALDIIRNYHHPQPDKPGKETTLPWRWRGPVETESSGNVTLETVRAIGETGVDFISSGSLTHSVTALDISLKITSMQSRSKL